MSAERAVPYFAAEPFFQEPHRLEELYERFAVILIKLGCFYDLAFCINGVCVLPPPPRKMKTWIVGCTAGRWINVLLAEERALLTLNGEDLYMTLYHPSEELLQTLRQLAHSEGLFLRSGETPQDR